MDNRGGGRCSFQTLRRAELVAGMYRPRCSHASGNASNTSFELVQKDDPDSPSIARKKSARRA